jgi:hypothetical protein
MLFSGEWMEVEDMLRDINQAQKDNEYFLFTHMQNLDLKNNNNMT